ncbi:DNA repair protein RadC [Thiomicrorhabdus sp. ZW0627]|uniref:RadC family protein n=1 Tax=Thiomicrorhabdus sp. ZW0627 TaxID=3039774 RepID=UPI002436F02B|nr:DNA repair protein RadC [Thiomicrorhabdus sp. ZW0627]MDG6773886.1 DNA repair protein RadC [Thiomicrorhabdus sp. ZW0627]
MAIRDWHEHDRPREKLLHFGPSSLSDAELLAIFLRVGVKGLSAVELAQNLLDHFGSLPALLNSSEQEFCEAKGLGQAKFVQLKAVLEMARRHFESGLKKGDAFTDPETVAHYLIHSIGFQQREQFGVLLLDQQHRLITFEVLFTGSLTQASVHPREVLKAVLDHHAAAVILTHNHPSGDPAPSQSDLNLTRTLSEALALIDVRCLDHIILGDFGRWHSLAQHNQMQRNDL